MAARRFLWKQVDDRILQSPSVQLHPVRVGGARLRREEGGGDGDVLRSVQGERHRQEVKTSLQFMLVREREEGCCSSHRILPHILEPPDLMKLCLQKALSCRSLAGETCIYLQLL